MRSVVVFRTQTGQATSPTCHRYQRDVVSCNGLAKCFGLNSSFTAADRLTCHATPPERPLADARLLRRCHDTNGPPIASMNRMSTGWGDRHANQTSPRPTIYVQGCMGADQKYHRTHRRDGPHETASARNAGLRSEDHPPDCCKAVAQHEQHSSRLLSIWLVAAMLPD
jgi:hypothetical protein